MSTTLKRTLLDILRTNPYVRVDFRTKAGHIRSMTCTRNWENVGNADGMDSDVLNGEGHIAVWDYLVKDWRAIRISAILHYEILENSDYAN